MTHRKSANDPFGERAERVDVILAVKEGLEEIARGEGLDIDEADDQMRRELGFAPRMPTQGDAGGDALG